MGWHIEGAGRSEPLPRGKDRYPEAKSHDVVISCHMVRDHTTYICTDLPFARTWSVNCMVTT